MAPNETADAKIATTIPAGMKERLGKIAHLEDRSEAAVIRRAIANYVESAEAKTATATQGAA